MENETADTTDTTPHHEMRKKQSKKYRDNLKTKVTETWYEIQPDREHEKGGKLVACSRTANGVQRQYVGREKEKPEFLAKLKKDGKIRSIS